MKASRGKFSSRNIPIIGGLVAAANGAIFASGRKGWENVGDTMPKEGEPTQEKWDKKRRKKKDRNKGDKCRPKGKEPRR